MTIELRKFPAILILTSTCLLAGYSQVGLADHRDGHVSEGVGQIDTTGYHCESPEGQLLGATECMLMKLDRIEKRLGCPLDEYLADTCPYSPADTTATFCISQGREGTIGAGWGLVPYLELELGAGWPNAVWGKGTGKLEGPLFVTAGPVPIPIPTELALGGSASLGRNFDICIEVPLEAVEHKAFGELLSDAEVIDNIVRYINEPYLARGPSKSKFQRRLGRLANYSIFRVPGTNRFPASSAGAYVTASSLQMNDDGESEFDAVETAMDAIFAGDWQLPQNAGPSGVLKSPLVDDLRTVLEIPQPVQNLIDDPDQIVGAVFESVLPGQALAGSSSSTHALGTPEALCENLGLNGELRDRFPAVAEFCGFFPKLPTLEKTTGIFALVDKLPTFDEVKQAVEDVGCLLSWSCDDES